MQANLMGILFILGSIILTFLLWGIPAIILWKWKMERRIYLINVAFGLLFLLAMYKLIAIKPRELHEFAIVAEEMINALIAWWLWGGMLLVYAILRRIMKRGENSDV
jgi:hypothetical protein